MNVSQAPFGNPGTFFLSFRKGVTSRGTLKIFWGYLAFFLGVCSNGSLPSLSVTFLSVWGLPRGISVIWHLTPGNLGPGWLFLEPPFDNLPLPLKIVSVYHSFDGAFGDGRVQPTAGS